MLRTFLKEWVRKWVDIVLRAPQITSLGGHWTLYEPVKLQACSGPRRCQMRIIGLRKQVIAETG